MPGRRVEIPLSAYYPNMSANLGPGHIPLLTAISQGRVTHNGVIIGSCYYLDGEPIGTMQVHTLVRLALVETRDRRAWLTPDGERALAGWDEDAWWREFRARGR